MPNHVHVVMVPRQEDGLHRSLAETHRRYTCHINFRENWKGYLWQGRFSSFPMDEAIYIPQFVKLNLIPLEQGCVLARICGNGRVHRPTLKKRTMSW